VVVMTKLRTLVLVMSVCVAAFSTSGGDKLSDGMLAASVGDEVVLAIPATGAILSMYTGPVGWLFPGPGGILFAPDVVNSKTTVINMRTGNVVDRMDGLSMPRFGEAPDRYIALAGEIMLVTYPERAVMASIPAAIAHPWQSIIAPDDAAMLVLERLPDGSTGVHMTTINLITRQLVYRRPLAGDIIRMALSPQLALLALADIEDRRIRLVEPATLVPIADYPTPGEPRDVAFVDNGKVLATAIETTDGNGILHLGVYKQGKHGLKLKKEHTVDLGSAPVRADRSPDGGQLAVALGTGEVVIVDVDQREVVLSLQLPGTPRDLRWCDPTREGPMVPEWSDGDAPDLDLGGFRPKISDHEASGLEKP
jgi:hypothetical protein